jgi:hypothetical protein
VKIKKNGILIGDNFVSSAKLKGKDWRIQFKKSEPTPQPSTSSQPSSSIANQFLNLFHNSPKNPNNADPQITMSAQTRAIAENPFQYNFTDPYINPMSENGRNSLPIAEGGKSGPRALRSNSISRNLGKR